MDGVLGDDVDHDDDDHPGDAPSLGGESAGNAPWLGGDRGLQPMLDGLGSGSDREIWQASRRIAAFGGAAFPRLIDFLADRDYRVRAVAAHALAALAEDKRVIPALPHLKFRLADANRTVRVLCAAAIDRIAEHYPAEAAEAVEAARRFRRTGRD